MIRGMPETPRTKRPTKRTATKMAPARGERQDAATTSDRASLHTDLMQVKGIGEKRAPALYAEGIRSVRDLLLYCPYGYLDRSRIIAIRDLPQYTQEAQEHRPFASRVREVTVVARVLDSQVGFAKQKRYLILTVDDEAGQRLKCLWFNGVKFFENAFERGEWLALSARPEWDKRGADIVFMHPKFDRLRSTDEGDPDWGRMFNTGRIIPKYSSGEDLQAVGLDSSRFRYVIHSALESHSHLIQECLPASLLKRLGLPGRLDALSSVHVPRSEADLKSGWDRMKFEELFYYELMVALRKRASDGGKRSHVYAQIGRAHV